MKLKEYLEESEYTKLNSNGEGQTLSSIKEVKREIKKSGFKILEINGKLQISDKGVRKYPPVFFICKK